MNKAVLIAKIQKRLAVLKDNCVVPVQPFELSGHICPDTASHQTSPLRLAEGSVWGGARKQFVLKGDFTASESKNLYLCLRLGRSASLESIAFLYGPEAVLYIDDKICFGIDPNHEEWLIPPEYCDGAIHCVKLCGWTGIKDEPYQVGYLGTVKVHEPMRKYTTMASLCLDTALAANDPSLSARLLEAIDLSLNEVIFSEDRGILSKSAKCALNTLTELLRAVPYEPLHNVTACGHGHLDLAWLWRTKTSVGKGLRTFSNALRLMDMYPDFYFSQSQAQLYKWVEEEAPELIERVREKINAGQWELLSGMWVEPDCNITGAESLVRQILLFDHYALKTFGTRGSPVAWLPDTFGFSPQLPQILLSAGIKYFATAKLTWNQYNRMPGESFIWRGLDGSEILSHIISTSKPKWWGATYSADLTAKELLSTVKKAADSGSRSGSFIIAYGMGDGGGGPTEEMVLRAKLLSDGLPGLPAVEQGTALQFFERLEKTKNLPIWQNDLYLELHRGTYTNQSRTKRRNKLCETALHNAEFLLSWSWDAVGADYPAEQLRELWQDQCLNQFHDILPGSSIHDVYVDEEQTHEEILSKCRTLTDKALSELEQIVDRRASCLAVNCTPFPWSGILRLPECLRGKEVCFDDRSVPAFRIENRPYAFLKNIPAYGFIALTSGELKEESTVYSRTPVAESSPVLENDLIKLSFDANGDIVSWIDKENGRELVAPGGSVAQWRLYEDMPGDWDAWDIDEYYKEKGFASAKLLSAERISVAGVIEGLIFEKEIGETHIRERIELVSGEKALSFSCKICWNDKHKMLRSVSQFDIHSRGFAQYGTQFGSVLHPDHFNTSWDQARFENCMQGWADLSEGDYGIGIASDFKYGIDIHENEINLAIQRGASFPDETAEQGYHEFTYCLIPHTGNSPDIARKKAYQIGNPPVVYMPSSPNGDISSLSMVPNVGGSLILETIKLAEAEDGIVLRAYECNNTRGTCDIEMYRNINTCSVVTLTEDKISDGTVHGKHLSVDLSPYKIVTLKIN